MNKQKVSIIVPVYNVEKYLDNCVESLLNQTYKDFEIILINDGSTDNSGQICDRLKEKDERIIVIHKENTGVSDTRNCGFEKATGDFIVLVDSDDMLHPNYLESMLSFAIKNNLDMVSCGFKRINEKSKRKVWKNIKNNSGKVFESHEYLCDMMTANILALAIAGGKMYRREKMRDKKMDVNLSQGEDVVFNYYFAKDAVNIGFINQPLYGYLKRNDSAVLSKYSNRKLIVMRVLESIMAENIQDTELYNAIGSWLYYSALESFYLMFKDGIVDREGYIYLKEILKKTTPCLRANKKAYLLRRVFAPIGVSLMNLFIKKGNKKPA